MRIMIITTVLIRLTIPTIGLISTLDTETTQETTIRTTTTGTLDQPIIGLTTAIVTETITDTLITIETIGITTAGSFSFTILKQG